MKSKELIKYIFLLIVSILLLIIGLFIIKGYYQPMLIGGSLGMGIPTSIHLIQYLYLHQPSNKKALEKKLLEEKIEKTDERIIMLKYKASSYTVQFMAIILLMSSFLSALFHLHWTYTALLFLLLIIGSIIWFSSYKVVKSRY